MEVGRKNWQDEEAVKGLIVLLNKTFGLSVGYSYDNYILYDAAAYPVISISEPQGGYAQIGISVARSENYADKLKALLSASGAKFRVLQYCKLEIDLSTVGGSIRNMAKDLAESDEIISGKIESVLNEESELLSGLLSSISDLAEIPDLLKAWASFLEAKVAPDFLNYFSSEENSNGINVPINLLVNSLVSELKDEKYLRKFAYSAAHPEHSFEQNREIAEDIYAYLDSNEVYAKRKSLGFDLVGIVYKDLHLDRNIFYMLQRCCTIPVSYIPSASLIKFDSLNDMLSSLVDELAFSKPDLKYFRKVRDLSEAIADNAARPGKPISDLRELYPAIQSKLELIESLEQLLRKEKDSKIKVA
ncbi:MAG: hypothetical protein ACP5TJ_01170 [Candidatus Micrarchaeia archaeon]